VLPPSDSDSDSGYEDYDVEFKDASSHRDSYYQDADENGGGSGIVQGRREGESEGDDSYHSEVLKSPISTNSDSDGTKKVIFPQFNEGASFGEFVLEAGMEFASLVIFKDVVRDYSIWKGKDIRWVKDESYRARAKCKQHVKGCQWEIYCRRNNLRKSFQIKTYHEHHTCSRDSYISTANRKWVVKMLVDKVRVQPTISHKEVYDYFKLAFNVILGDSKITRSLREAREIVEGSEKEQYGLVRDYAKELERSNPESTLKIDTIPIPNSPPQFQRFYVCLDACKKGFKVGCRPFIGLDGCFLKGYHGGQLLSAVGQDANNHIYVIAYAIVDVENKDNWKWFLSLLQNDLGQHTQHGWNFISDMQKVLLLIQYMLILLMLLLLLLCRRYYYF